ncbi:uncharacterized protein FOMMEDRAFT_151399 [Fomitiporia mediterranea MF3/22]|uniref:uncharacterized protein n=1 Tax=Fomitiporia mediterranea (strain MF3/22) TaxID=694068 RepID=UPI0004407F0B|nr:uncharacterized protein FOMMEDRAFT_151399 [Fomitiporia mediterranea MF3/22]EJD08537.1 hypothetical protein FOMMEDRAFT_151399 [Fomitiporia mediterranea MF3/22]
MIRRSSKNRIPTSSSMGNPRTPGSAPCLRQVNLQVLIKGCIKRVRTKFSRAPMSMATLSVPIYPPLNASGQPSGDANRDAMIDDQGKTTRPTRIPMAHKKFVKTKYFFEMAAAVLVLGAEAISTMSDVFPPAKAAVGGVLHIIDMDRKLQVDKEESKKLEIWIEDRGKMLGDTISRGAGLCNEYKEAAMQLDCILVDAAEAISLDLHCNWFIRLTNLRKRSDRRRWIRENVETAFEDFQFRVNTLNALRIAIVHDSQVSVHAEYSDQKSRLSMHSLSGRKETIDISPKLSGPLSMNHILAFFFDGTVTELGIRLSAMQSSGN